MGCERRLENRRKGLVPADSCGMYRQLLQRPLLNKQALTELGSSGSFESVPNLAVTGRQDLVHYILGTHTTNHLVQFSAVVCCSHRVFRRDDFF